MFNNGRKAQSKVNKLRDQVSELTKEVYHYSNVSYKIIKWVHDNGTEEQKQQFGEYIQQVTKEMENTNEDSGSK